MKRFKINKKIRNEFLYQTVYGLFYPAALGAVLVYIMQDALSGELFRNGIFPLATLIWLVWYFILDYYVGFTNFKGDEKSYDFRYMMCDVTFIIAAFVAYYGLWLSKLNLDFLFFISFTVITVLLIILDYFDVKDAKRKFEIRSSYCISMSILSILSVGMIIVSLTLSESLFYSIAKYLFILLAGIILIFYTLYILSDDSFDIK
jgi:hypothetical protein